MYSKYINTQKKISQILWLIMLLWLILSNKRQKIRQKNGFILKIRESDYNKFLGILKFFLIKKNGQNPVVGYVVMVNFVLWNMENPGKSGFKLKIRESD